MPLYYVIKQLPRRVTDLVTLYLALLGDPLKF